MRISDWSSDVCSSDLQIAELLEKGPLETADGDKAAPAQAAPKQAAPVQTAKVTAGDVVLQLSSVKSEAAAGQEWKRLQAEQPGLLGKRAVTLGTGAVQGTTYYRSEEHTSEIQTLMRHSYADF